MFETMAAPAALAASTLGLSTAAALGAGEVAEGDFDSPSLFFPKKENLPPLEETEVPSKPLVSAELPFPLGLNPPSPFFLSFSAFDDRESESLLKLCFRFDEELDMAVLRLEGFGELGGETAF